MINFKSDLKKILNEVRLKRCGLVLISTGIGFTTTGCIENIDNYNDIKPKTTRETYIVITDKPKQTTTKESETKVSTRIISTTILNTTTVSETTFEEPTEIITEVPTITETPTETPTEETISNLMYKCNNGYAKYEICEGDTLEELSNKTGISKDEIKRINNIESDEINQTEIILPALLVKYHITENKRVGEISNETGIELDEICKLNEVPNDFIFSKNSNIYVKTLFFGENYYETLKGKANIINNTILFGDKIINSENNYLVFNNYMFLYGTNEVILYTFNDENYTYKNLFYNVKDIELVDDIPVIYIRTNDDIEYLINNANAYCYNVNYDDLVTVNIENYPIYVDSNNDVLCTYDGEKYNFEFYDEKEFQKNIK